MPYHADYEKIVTFVDEGSRVLDLGCGTGGLMESLIREKRVSAMGIDIDPKSITRCVKKGLSVFHGNIDEGLKEYQDNSYDYVILNRTLQVTHKPEYVIKEMLRVGRKGIIGFPNFAYWRIRSKLFFTGKTPKSKLLPFEWYETPNIRWVTIADFKLFCKKMDISIIDEIYLSKKQRELHWFKQFLKNIYAEEGIFVLTRKD